MADKTRKAQSMGFTGSIIYVVIFMSLGALLGGYAGTIGIAIGVAIGAAVALAILFEVSTNRLSKHIFPKKELEPKEVQGSEFTSAPSPKPKHTAQNAQHGATLLTPAPQQDSPKSTTSKEGIGSSLPKSRNIP